MLYKMIMGKLLELLDHRGMELLLHLDLLLMMLPMRLSMMLLVMVVPLLHQLDLVNQLKGHNKQRNLHNLLPLLDLILYTVLLVDPLVGMEPHEVMPGEVLL